MSEMSSDPASSTIGTGEAMLPEKNESLVTPLSAGHNVDYIMNVELETGKGSDIVICNDKLGASYDTYHTKMWLKRQFGETSEHFDQKKEDYWLFHVHLNNAEMEIAIGGETPVLVNSKPNWQTISSEEGQSITVKSPRWHFKVSLVSDTSYPARERPPHDRFVAVRCPKMDNPAISVKVNGHYGGLHWVGLFVKTTAANKNQFIAVKTNVRMLPAYAARMRKYPTAPKWLSEDSAIDVLDRTLTLWPKQLYGTKGNSASLYDRYITQDPENRIGREHFQRVHRKIAEGKACQALKYVWYSSGETNFWVQRIEIDHLGTAYYNSFDHVRVVNTRENAENGLNILLTAFGGAIQMVVGFFTGNVAGAVTGILKYGEVFDDKKMAEEADLNGFISSVAKGVDEFNKVRKGWQKKAEKPNTTNIYIITKNIQNGEVVTRDFGTAAELSATLPPVDQPYTQNQPGAA